MGGHTSRARGLDRPTPTLTLGTVFPMHHGRCHAYGLEGDAGKLARTTNRAVWLASKSHVDEARFMKARRTGRHFALGEGGSAPQCG